MPIWITKSPRPLDESNLRVTRVSLVSPFSPVVGGMTWDRYGVGYGRCDNSLLPLVFGLAAVLQPASVGDDYLLAPGGLGSAAGDDGCSCDTHFAECCCAWVSRMYGPGDEKVDGEGGCWYDGVLPRLSCSLGRRGEEASQQHAVLVLPRAERGKHRTYMRVDVSEERETRSRSFASAGLKGRRVSVGC